MNSKKLKNIGLAVLVALVAAMGSDFLSKQMVKPQALEKNVFTIEAMAEEAPAPAAATAEAAAPAAAPAAESVLGMIATADIAKGEKVAKACMACHTFTKGGKNGVGPNLWGVVGGPKQHMADYKYSGALAKSAGATWTLGEINKYLTKPKDYAPGNKMAFAGVKKAEDRAALLAWLRQQSDAPVALPSAADIAAETAQ